MRSVLLVLVLLVGCGHDNDGLVDLNVPSSSNIGPKTAVLLEGCQAFYYEEYCYCLNKIAANHCSRFITHASNEYNECIKPFLNDAYNGYCTISKQWSVQVQR